MRKKILYLENGIGYGGAAISLKVMLAHLDRVRFRPFVVTSRKEGNYGSFADVAEWHCIRNGFFSKSEMQDKAVRWKGNALFLKSLSALDYICNVLPYTLRLMAFCMRHRIDLVHINNEPVNNLAGILAARALSIPCICHLRGTLWDSSLTRRLLGIIDFFLPVSNYIRDELAAYGVPLSRCEVVKEGLDFEQLLPKGSPGRVRGELGVSGDTPLLGIAGVLIDWKGQRTVIEAMPLIHNEFPACKLLVIGEAPSGCEGYETELRNLVMEKGLEEKVIFTGYRSDVGDVIQDLDILIHASTSPEPFGRVIIEGMALGKPVVASALGGPLEIIESEMTGMLVPAGDPVPLAASICMLLQDADLGRSLGERAQAEVREKYSIETHTRQIEDVYGRILGV